MLLQIPIDPSDSITLIAYIATLAFTFLLAKETKWERPWSYFFLAAVLLTAGFLVRSVWFEGVFDALLQLRIQQAGEVLGSLAIAWASYEIWRGMRKIRKTLSD